MEIDTKSATPYLDMFDEKSKALLVSDIERYFASDEYAERIKQTLAEALGITHETTVPTPQGGKRSL